MSPLSQIDGYGPGIFLGSTLFLFLITLALSSIAPLISSVGLLYFVVMCVFVLFVSFVLFERRSHTSSFVLFVPPLFCLRVGLLYFVVMCVAHLSLRRRVAFVLFVSLLRPPCLRVVARAPLGLAWRSAPRTASLGLFRAHANVTAHALTHSRPRAPSFAPRYDSTSPGAGTMWSSTFASTSHSRSLRVAARCGSPASASSSASWARSSSPR